MHSFFKAQVLTASVLCVLLAVVADLLLLGAAAAADALDPGRRRRGPTRRGAR